MNLYHLITVHVVNKIIVFFKSSYLLQKAMCASARKDTGLVQFSFLCNCFIFGLKMFIRGQYKGRSPSNLSSNFMQNEGLTFLLAQS